MPATEHAVQELQRLVALLENSGAAHRRADVQALLEASRQALGDVALPRRAAGTGRDKLRRLATLALDGAALLLVLIGMGAPAPFLAAAAWAGFRLRHRAGWLVEAWLRLLDGLAWSWDWLAEAFTAPAARRFAAREAAHRVLDAWLHHARSLPGTPRLADVEALLMARYGPAAAAAFRTHAGTLKPFPAKRLGQLWQSALLRGFRAVAAEGAFWVARPARPEPPKPAPPEAPAEAPHLALRDARRIELKNQLRKRHQEVANAHGWTVKTPPEIAERDRYLAQLRATIAALEAELEALRG